MQCGKFLLYIETSNIKILITLNIGVDFITSIVYKNLDYFGKNTILDIYVTFYWLRKKQNKLKMKSFVNVELLFNTYRWELPTQDPKFYLRTIFISQIVRYQ